MVVPRVCVCFGLLGLISTSALEVDKHALEWLRPQSDIMLCRSAPLSSDPIVGKLQYTYSLQWGHSEEWQVGGPRPGCDSKTYNKTNNTKDEQ